MSDPKYTVRMVIETIDESTGERSEPSNTLTDATHGLSADQTVEYHYALKRAYCRCLTELDADAQTSLVNAASA